MVVSLALGMVIVPTALETLTRGRSLGKLAMGLRTVRVDGGPISFRHALVRAVLGVAEIYLFFGVPALITAMLNSKGKRLGDLVAGTYVVRNRYSLSPHGVVEVPAALLTWVASADIAPLPEEKKAKILPFIRAWAESATRFSGQDIYSGFAQSMALRKATEQATRRFDYVLSPTAPIPAFPAELPSPTNDPEMPFEHIAFTLPYNMSEQPASSVNCGYTSDGLPIGLQIAGRRFDDLGVLQMSRAWEKMRPKQRDWPTDP